MLAFSALAIHSHYRGWAGCGAALSFFLVYAIFHEALSIEVVVSRAYNATNAPCSSDIGECIVVSEMPARLVILPKGGTVETN